MPRAWTSLLLLALVACGPGSEVGAAKTTSGPAETSAAPPRAVCLAPSLTRIWIEVAGASSIVGVDRFSAELSEVAGASVLGGLYAPDLERLVELEPTLVLGVQSAQQAPLFEQLRARGVRVETFQLHSLAQVLEAFERIGRLAGAPDAGRELARGVREALEELARATEGRPRPRVALVVDREPLFVVGGGSFAHALIEAAGGENVFGDLGAAYPRVSLEALADRAPDLVLETTDPGEAAAHGARAYWSRFAFVPRFEALPRGDVVLPSPALPRAARLLRDAIHPDLRDEARAAP